MSGGRVPLEVNGASLELEGPGLCSLAEALASARGEGAPTMPCAEGVCGACSVLVDGHLVASCITPLRQLEGTRVTTFDGLLREGTDRSEPLVATALQLAAFADQRGLFPCDLCRDGVLLAATVDLVVRREGRPSAALASRVCRCSDLAELVEEVKRRAPEGDA